MCVFVCVCARVCVCLYVCVCVRACVCVYHMYAYVYARMHMEYICVYIYDHIHATQRCRMNDANLQALSAKYQRTPAQLLIRWCLAKGCVLFWAFFCERQAIEAGMNRGSR